MRRNGRRGIGRDEASRFSRSLMRWGSMLLVGRVAGRFPTAAAAARALSLAEREEFLAASRLACPVQAIAARLG